MNLNSFIFQLFHLNIQGRYIFEFSKDLLFIKKGDKYIFQILYEIFIIETVNYWKISQPFFRKYALFLIEEEK